MGGLQGNLGNTKRLKGDLDGAITDLSRAAQAKNVIREMADSLSGKEAVRKGFLGANGTGE
jgi:hypothetical protein